MRSTIDKAGRLVIPRQLREELGLPAGGAVDVRFVDGRIEIEPVRTSVRLVERDGYLAAEPAEPADPADPQDASGPAAPLTDEDVRALLERGRR